MNKEKILDFAIDLYYQKSKREGITPAQPTRKTCSITSRYVFLRSGNDLLSIFDHQVNCFVELPCFNKADNGNEMIFFTVPETSEILNVTPQTTRAYIKRGMLWGKRIGRPVLIPGSALAEFYATIR